MPLHILIEIDCENGYCSTCENVNNVREYCNIFQEFLDRENDDFLRCSECHEAEYDPEDQ